MKNKADEYRELLDGFIVSSVPADNGDYDAFCPAHENPASSKKPSARINFRPTNAKKYPNGLISCFVCNFSGDDAGLDNIVEMYQARVKAGVKFEKVNRQERTLKFGESGTRKKLRLPDVLTRREYRRALFENKARLTELKTKRGLTDETIKKFGIGWIEQKKAYCYPVHLDGKVYALRLYRTDPHARVKHVWFDSEGEHVPQMYGLEYVADEPILILAEGEFDTMLMQQDGLKAVGHNGGAGKFKVEWIHHFRDKVVYIAYDNDAAGHKGREMVKNHLKSVTKAIYYIDVPNPAGIDPKTGKSYNGSDYTDFRVRDGHSLADFEQLMLEARKRGPESETVSSGLPMTGKPVSISQSTASQYVGVPLEMTVQVIGKFDGYVVPNRVVIECTSDKGEKICATCPVQGGSFDLQIPKNSSLIERIVEAPDERVEKLIIKEVGAKCRDKITSIEREGEWAVEKVVVGESVEARGQDSESHSLAGTNASMTILNVDAHDSQVNEIYRVVGHNVPNPKDQHTMFVTWVREETKTNIDQFVLTEDVKKELMIFRPTRGETVLKKLDRIAKDLSRNVAGIVQREDLVIAYDIVWHSALSFYFNNTLDERGWVELLVFGDTRTGKSATAQKLATHYRHGKVFSSEGATRAGLVGGATPMGTSKNYIATWGVLPQNDRRLIVLDEAQALQDLVKDISSIRSKGVAEIVKVGINQSTMSRTRLIWIANPIGKEKLDELANGAMTALNEFMPASEDRARFELAVALSYEDVTASAIHRGIMEKAHAPKYSSEACESLILWAWSRKPDQIKWAAGVEQYVLDTTLEIVGKYEGDFELVQASNMHVKLARIAVAIAARVFSADESGENLIVKREHVTAARDFLYRCYDNPSLGLGQAATRQRADSKRAEGITEQIREWFVSGAIAKMPGVPNYGHEVYNGLSRTEGHFNQRDFGSITGLEYTNALAAFTFLRDNSMLTYESKTGMVKITRELGALLKELRDDE